MECLEGQTKPLLEYEPGNIDSVNIGRNETSDLSPDFDGTTQVTDVQITTSTQSIKNANHNDLRNGPILRRSLRTNAGVPHTRYGSSDICLVTQNRLSTSSVSQPVVRHLMSYSASFRRIRGGVQ